MADSENPLSVVPKFGDGIGLARCRAYLDDCDLWNALMQMKRVGVTGSSGKGAVARMAAAAFRDRGLHTGRFISPHFQEMRERLAVDGDWISADALRELLDRAIARCARLIQQHPQLGRFGRFEVLFLAAMEWFVECHCDAVILEAGIGGRYDPLRVVLPQTLILTCVDLEHTDLLGETVEEIACDKLDAAPQGAVVVRPRLEDAIEARIRSYLDLRGVRQRVVTPDPIASASLNPRGPWYGLNRELVIMSLLEAVPDITRGDAAELMDRSMAGCFLPGNFVTHLWRGRKIVVDGAHTRRALEALSTVASKRPGVCIVGLSMGRSTDPLASAVQMIGQGYTTYVVQPAQRGMPAMDLGAALQRSTVGLDIRVDNVQNALRQVAEQPVSVPVYVFGSLFLAAEISAELGGAMWEPSGF